MKIMTQNRDTILEQPRQMWVSPNYEGTEDYAICSNVKRVPTLGVYQTESRAMEILKDIFESQRRGLVNFYMPLEQEVGHERNK